MTACWRCGGAGTVGCVDYTDPCPCCEPARTSAGPADLLPRAIASAIDCAVDACELAVQLRERARAEAAALLGHASVAVHAVARVDLRSGLRSLWRTRAARRA
jgi:hypothetical protein